MEIPAIGLGTWELTGENCVKTVQLALRVGYRHIDTAHVYENHEAIKKGLESFDREKLFLTSKLAIDEEINLSDIETSVQRACEKTLKELGTDYLDLYLIHWPVPNFPHVEIYKAMERLVEQGKVIQIGVSNYKIHHLEALQSQGMRPFANQVEFHPLLNQVELLDYCASHQIKLISYRPFGKGKLLNEEPLLAQIGEKYGKNGAQVILRWLMQKKIPAIPKASSELHLKQNLDILNFELTSDEMKKLNSLGKNHRYCQPDNPAFD